MIPHIHLDYFGGIAMDSLPSFKEMMYIFRTGMVVLYRI